MNYELDGKVYTEDQWVLTYTYQFDLPDTVADGPVAITYSAVDDAGNSSGHLDDRRLLTVVERPVFTHVSLYNLKGERVYDRAYDLSPIYPDSQDSGTYWEANGNKYYNFDPRSVVEDQWIKAATSEFNLGTDHAAILLVRSTRALAQMGRQVDTSIGLIGDLRPFTSLGGVGPADLYAYDLASFPANNGIIDPDSAVPVHTYFALLKLNNAQEGSAEIKIGAYTRQDEFNYFAQLPQYGHSFVVNRGYDKDGNGLYDLENGQGSPVSNWQKSWERPDAFFYVDTSQPSAVIDVYSWKDSTLMYTAQNEFNLSAPPEFLVQLKPVDDSPTDGYLIKNMYKVWDPELQVFREGWTPVEKPAWWPASPPSEWDWNDVGKDELGISGATMEVAIQVAVSGANPDRSGLELDPIEYLSYRLIERTDAGNITDPLEIKVDTIRVERIEAGDARGWLYDYVFTVPRDIADCGIGARVSLTDNAGNYVEVHYDEDENPLFWVAEQPRFEIVELSAPSEDRSDPADIGAVPEFAVYGHREDASYVFSVEHPGIAYSNSPESGALGGINLKPVCAGEPLSMLVRSNRPLYTGGEFKPVKVFFPDETFGRELTLKKSDVQPLNYTRYVEHGVYEYYYRFTAGSIAVPTKPETKIVEGYSSFTLQGFVKYPEVARIHNGAFYVDYGLPEIDVRSVMDTSTNQSIHGARVRKRTEFDPTADMKPVTEPIEFTTSVAFWNVNPDATQAPWIEPPLSGVPLVNPVVHPLRALHVPVRVIYNGDEYNDMRRLDPHDSTQYAGLAFQTTDAGAIWNSIVQGVSMTAKPVTGLGLEAAPYQADFSIVLPPELCLGERGQKPPNSAYTYDSTGDTTHGWVTAELVVVDNAGNKQTVFAPLFEVTEQPIFREITIMTTDTIEHAEWRRDPGAPNTTPTVFTASRTDVEEEDMAYIGALESIQSSLGYNLYQNLPMDENSPLVAAILRNSVVKSVAYGDAESDTLSFKLVSNRRLEVSGDGNSDSSRDVKAVFTVLDAAGNDTATPITWKLSRDYPSGEYNEAFFKYVYTGNVSVKDIVSNVHGGLVRVDIEGVLFDGYNDHSDFIAHEVAYIVVDDAAPAINDSDVKVLVDYVESTATPQVILIDTQGEDSGTLKSALETDMPLNLTMTITDSNFKGELTDSSILEGEPFNGIAFGGTTPPADPTVLTGGSGDTSYSIRRIDDHGSSFSPAAAADLFYYYEFDPDAFTDVEYGPVYAYFTFFDDAGKKCTLEPVQIFDITEIPELQKMAFYSSNKVSLTGTYGSRGYGELTNSSHNNPGRVFDGSNKTLVDLNPVKPGDPLDIRITSNVRGNPMPQFEVTIDGLTVAVPPTSVTKYSSDSSSVVYQLSLAVPDLAVDEAQVIVDSWLTSKQADLNGDGVIDPVAESLVGQVTGWLYVDDAEPAIVVSPDPINNFLNVIKPSSLVWTASFNISASLSEMNDDMNIDLQNTPAYDAHRTLVYDDVMEPILRGPVKSMTMNLQTVPGMPITLTKIDDNSADMSINGNSIGTVILTRVESNGQNPNYDYQFAFTNIRQLIVNETGIDQNAAIEAEINHSSIDLEFWGEDEAGYSFTYTTSYEFRIATTVAFEWVERPFLMRSGSGDETDPLRQPTSTRIMTSCCSTSSLPAGIRWERRAIPRITIIPP